MLGISLFKHLDVAMLRSEQERTISEENMSHAEMPGYKAKRLNPDAFESLLKNQSGTGKIGVTHPQHMILESNLESLVMDAEFERTDATGNTVSPVDEMVKQKELNLQHSRSIALRKTFKSMMDTIINRVA